MVRRIGIEDMRATSPAAVALEREAAGGVGSPFERRIADALIELNRKLDERSQTDAEVIDALEQTRAHFDEAAEGMKVAADAYGRIDDEVVEALERNVRKILNVAIPAESGRIVEAAEIRIGMAADSAAECIRNITEKTEESMGRSLKAAESIINRTKGKSVLDQLSIVGKTALVMVVTVSLVVLCFAGWRFLPAVQGEVQISYTDEYRSELDRTKLELELVKNELDAYKEAYPEGLSESRLHDLNERNDTLRANY